MLMERVILGHGHGTAHGSSIQQQKWTGKDFKTTRAALFIKVCVNNCKSKPAKVQFMKKKKCWAPFFSLKDQKPKVE